ncbi:hypothetical protein COO60DRAFT_646067 [Scenedesmus sp. NREL 46B-D3]|nr:hypothetical protein COO60DRAFT_646067 [Scenedesmus sp. NREL 46B-D3]
MPKAAGSVSPACPALGVLPACLPLSALQSSRFMRAESSSHLGCEFSSSVEATPRATPRSGRKISTTGHLPPRESRSSHQHMERLQSARQSGVYRPTSSSSGAPAAAGSNGGLSHRQPLAAAGSCSSLKEQASRLTSAASSSSSARVPAAHGGIPTSRSSARGDAGVPMTSHISGVVKSRVTELSSSTMSMRQSGVYMRSSSSMAAGSAAAGAAAVRGGSAASGAATSRAGSRWK